MSAATREAVAARSMKLLHSEAVADRRRAVAALAQMKNERVIAPLFAAAGDADAEVATTALGALLEIGEAVRPLAAGALQKNEPHLWRAALVAGACWRFFVGSSPTGGGVSSLGL